MAKTVAHLGESARDTIELSVEERIEHLRRPRWIGYSQAKKVLNQLEDLLTHPKTHRMPSLLLIGDTNAGKTMLAQRFVHLHPACDNPEGDAAVVPVLMVLVGLGTKEALRAIQADPQLANRFTPVTLPAWHMSREFLMLLASFEKTLPLRQPSRLTHKALAQKLLAQSEGNLGELSTLLTAAAIYAVRTGIEHINDEVLAAIGWVPPSQRRQQAERLV